MNNKFDELTKQMAQSVTRRGALRKFGVGLTGMALACFGLESNAGVQSCVTSQDCSGGQICCGGTCYSELDNNHCGSCNNVCPPGTTCKRESARGWRGIVHAIVCAY